MFGARVHELEPTSSSLKSLEMSVRASSAQESVPGTLMFTLNSL